MSPIDQSKLTFRASAGVYKLELAHGTERPVKLGDGSFGAVFAAENSKKEKFAVKVFYSTKDELVTDRFKSEMRATEILTKKLQTSNTDDTDHSVDNSDLISNLVLPVAHTDKFLDSSCYSELHRCHYFKDNNLSVSQYALVMPRYVCTLKHLLEQGRPAGVRVGKEIDSSPGRAGYDVLNEMTPTEREGFVAWVAKEIIAGLRALHEAGLFHHDLKPANILIRPRGFRLELAISDLGFLKPNSIFSGEAGTKLIKAYEGLPLGTRHYRSPEQKDYFDVCEVQMNDETENLVALRTKDPKFRDTLAEKNDVLIFSKDPDRTPHVIEDVTHSDAEAGLLTEAKKEVSSADTSADGVAQPVNAAYVTKITIKQNSDKKIQFEGLTQVEIHKWHTIRTDLFGLGAIIYDLLTCGRSPERFYDYIRRWDRADMSVSELQTEYTQVVNEQTTRPDLTSAFNELRKDGNYTPLTIVNVLFRCMLPHARGSYAIDEHDPKKTAPPSQVFERLLNDLDLIGNTERESQSGHNRIWHGLRRTESVSHGTPLPFEKQLIELSSQVGLQRLAQGYLKLLDISETLLSQAEDFAKDKDSKTVFLKEMWPSNIDIVSGELRPKLPYHKNYADYLESFKGRLRPPVPMHAKSKFVPYFLYYMSRKVLIRDGILLTETETTSSANKPKHDFRAQFCYLDNTPFWSGPESGDLIITNANEANATHFELKLGSIPNSYMLDIALKNKKATLVKLLRPIDYYLSMLGIYIHHLFFSGIADNGETPPNMYYIEQSIVTGHYDASKISKIVGDRLKNPLKKQLLTKPKNAYLPCHRQLAQLYVWLTGRFFRRFTDRKEVEQIVLVRQHLKILYEDIAFVFGTDPDTLRMKVLSGGVPGTPAEVPPEHPSLNQLIDEQFVK